MASPPETKETVDRLYAHLFGLRERVKLRRLRAEKRLECYQAEETMLTYDLMALLVRIPEDPDEETLPKLLDDARFVAACEFAVTYGSGDELCDDEGILDMPF